MLQPLLSIVVPTWNEIEKTIRCFYTIALHTKSAYELIWVDNGSSPENHKAVTKQIDKLKIPTKAIKLKKNMGFVKASNTGINNASPDSKYIILLNNDTEVSTNWATKLIAPLKDATIGAVGPTTQSQMSWQAANHLNRRWKLGLPVFQPPPSLKDNERTINKYASVLHKKFENKYVETQTIPLSFFCVALRKDTIQKVGLLDEAFGYGLGDDDEYCFRLRTYGYKLILSLGTFVYHWHRTTFKALKLPVDTIHRANLRTLQAKKKQITASVHV